MRRIFTLFFLIFLGKSITGVAQNAPTGFTVGTATSSSLQFSWTDGGAGTTDFYVVRHTSSTMTALTAPSSAYSVGSVLAAGTVVAILPAATTTLNNNTGLNPSTQYFYQIWAHKTGGDSFNGTPLAGTMTTTAAAPSFSSAVATSLTSITVTFDQSITAITNVNGSDFTSASFTATGAALSAGNVILTVNTLSGTNFTCSDLAIAAGAVTGTSLTNASISGKTVSDGIAPTVTSVVRKTPATASTNAASVVFTVTFSENVNNLATNDFSAAMGAGVSGATITNVSAAAGTSVDVTVSTISGNGTLGLNVLTANGINDNATNALTSGTPTGSNQNYTIDQTIPTVTSVVRKTPATASTNAASVIFTVTFSENVNNLATNDFSAAMGAGVSGATITNVSAASGTSVDVTVGTISGNGTLGLNVLTANGINDDVTNALASGTPTGSNQSYTIDNTIPTVTSVVLKTPATSPTNASSVIFTVTFSENVNNLATNDFSAAMGAGVSGATITNVSAASGTSVDVTVGTIAGNGTLGLNVLTANGINDDATNALASGTPTGSNQSYTIDQTIPTVTSVVRKTPATSLTNAASVIFTVTFSE